MQRRVTVHEPTTVAPSRISISSTEVEVPLVLRDKAQNLLLVSASHVASAAPPFGAMPEVNVARTSYAPGAAAFGTIQSPMSTFDTKIERMMSPSFSSVYATDGLVGETTSDSMV